MIKKIIVLLVFLNLSLYANFEEGKKLFNEKCSSCHKEYISFKKLKENFFQRNNTLLNLKIPTVNMLAYAIVDSAKHIGDKNDPEMQQVEIEEYLKEYLENPDINNSICDEQVLKYYSKKKPMIISDEEAEKLALFFMGYKEDRLKSVPKTIKKLSKNYNEKELLSDAQKSHKHLMVYATSQTCYFCKKMKKEVLDLSDIQKQLNKNYIFLEVDVDFVKLPFNLQKSFKGMTPTFFVVRNDGKLLNTYPGAWVKKDFFEIMKENLQ